MIRLALPLGAVALVLTSTAMAAPVKLGTDRADFYMRTALARRYSSFRNGANKRTNCTQRITRGRVRCRPSWFLGDLSFLGKGVIWVTYPHHRPTWNYAWTIWELNEYCLQVEERPIEECESKHVVR